MRFGVVVFPGTWSDCDFHYVISEVLHRPVKYVWHRERDLDDLDCVVLPGGFSYGDYLRAGAVAGRSPVVDALGDFVGRGGHVLGSCNGFQILCEAGLLPGALMRNECLQYRCQPTHLVVENVETAFTRGLRPRQVLTMPISHGEGKYHADPEALRTPKARSQGGFRLGAEPPYAELGLFEALWSEHCAYKHSRVDLSRLPTEGPRVLQGPGENAGAIDIGDGWAVVFKMESHNHPSFIEPFQGAATGVGGILRDIFTMGARPIAILDSLRFGDPDDPRTRRLIDGVVSGISWYGNCFGCPTVGGEIAFAPEYGGNPLVNVMCVGLVRADRIFRARADGVGNPVFYVGNKTGRDGIHAATMASPTFDEHAHERRPTVQVGDPFTEKLLLEACLEVMRTGAVVGIQDMGAAGLACCTSEMPAGSGTGMAVELSSVPQREEGMSAYELLLSESQERMLLVAERGREDELRRVFAKWELDAVKIGGGTGGPGLVVRHHGEEVAHVPVEALADGPRYEKPYAPPAWLAERRAFDPLTLPEPKDYGETLARLMRAPTLAP